MIKITLIIITTITILIKIIASFEKNGHRQRWTFASFAVATKGPPGFLSIPVSVRSGCNSGYCRIDTFICAPSMIASRSWFSLEITFCRISKWSSKRKMIQAIIMMMNINNNNWNSYNNDNESSNHNVHWKHNVFWKRRFFYSDRCEQTLQQ